MDVKCVILNMDLDQKIYMKQLDGYEVLRCKYFVYKLKNTIYGLKQVQFLFFSNIFFLMKCAPFHSENWREI
jgi:hypothetical protein